MSVTSMAQPRLWAVLAVVLIADIMDLLDSTLTNIAAPTIERDLGGGHAFISWLGASYALALGSLLVLGARLGDRFGPARLLLLGLAGFTLASLACGLAFDPAMLIAARLLQGAFGALMIPQGFTLLRSSFSREQLRPAFSVFGPVMGLSAVLGPILGGFLIDADVFGTSWRMMFLINIVLGAAAFMMAMRVLPAIPARPNVVLDGLGSMLLVGMMFLLLYGLISGADDGWSAGPILMLIAGAVLFALFAWRQATAKNPLLEPSVLRNRGVTSGLILGLFFFAGLSGMSYVVSLFLQLGLGRSPTGAALNMVPLAAGLIVSAIAGNVLMARLGRTLVPIGLSVTLVGVVALGLLINGYGLDITVWEIGPPIFVLGLGMGLCFGTIFDIALGDITPEETGSASGALNAVQQIASSIGSAVMTTVFFKVIPHNGVDGGSVISLVVVAAIVILCLGLVRLLPRHGRPEEEEPETRAAVEAAAAV